jgi:hypothetical protein
MTIGFADMKGEVVHIGKQPRVQQNRRIDLPGPGIFGRVVKEIGKTSEKLSENGDRRFTH